MNAAEIVERAAALRVRLWVEAERIVMEGPARGVATIKPEIATNKPKILAYLLGRDNAQAAPAGADADPPDGNISGNSAGALIDPNGGAYLPWGPYLAPADVRRMRGELCATIDELAARESWPRSHKNEILSLATDGSLANLLQDRRYFDARLRGQRVQSAAREQLAARTWQGEGLDGRRA